MRLALLLAGLATTTWAQTTTSAVTKVIQTNRQADLNWLMGNSTYWMVMNRGSLGTVVMTGKHALGAGGSSVASDSTGNLLFYTDGKTVYDANHSACASCSNLDGDPSYDQPSAICELNRAVNQYAIFTNSAGGVKVSVADMTGGLHISSTNQTVGVSNTTGLITVPQSDGTGYYAIYQSAAPSNILQVVTVVPGTTNTFTPQPVTIATPNNAAFTVRNFAYNNATKMLAITPTGGPVILVKVGAAIGTLRFEKTVRGSEAFAVSDCEFSLDGKYLYLSKKGTNANDGGVFRYTVDSNDALASVLGTTTINAGYDLQLAADGNIYHIYQASGNAAYLVGRLTGVDKPAATDVKYSLTINKNKIKIDNLGGTRFPSFLPPKNLTVTVDFDFAGRCLNAPTTFFPKTTPTADSVHWSFLSGNSQPWSPVNRFKTTPNSVTMTAYYDGETVGVSKQVALQTVNLKLKLPQDTTACSCELSHPINKNTFSPTPPCTPFKLKVKATGGTPTSYIWSTGATTAETPVDSAGYYYVVATDPATGCTAYAGTTVKEYGQSFNHRNYWYFGNKAWMDFTNPTRQPPLPTPLKNNMNAPQGCNLACDLMGNPIFYTDGMTVWDRKGNEMATNIGGSEGTQVEVVRVPEDTTLFYIFTPRVINSVPREYEMRYSLFDLRGTHTVASGTEMGAIVSSNKLLFSTSTERVFHNGNWLVAHEFGNNIFRAYKMTDKGIGQPRTSAIGTIHDSNVPGMGAGQIKLLDTLLAVAVSRISTPPNSTDYNRVDLFYFDPGLGLVSDYRPLNIGSVAGQVYGVAISPGKTKLLASVRNGTGRGIYEFLIKDPAPTPGVVPRLLPKIDDQGNDLGAMNYAPDGQLYIAVNGKTYLGKIAVNEAGKDANGNPLYPSSALSNGSTLETGTTSNWGLPTWVSNHTGSTDAASVKVEPNRVCLGKPVKLTATRSDPKIDAITWDLDNKLGGKQFPNEDSIKWTYTASGTYHPKLKLTNRCIKSQGCDKTFEQPFPSALLECSPNKDSLILKTEDVKVFQKLKALNIPNPSALCLSSSVVLDANKNSLNGPSGDLKFLWEPSRSTTPTLTLTAPGIISKVTVTDKEGCKIDQTNIFVGDDRPQLLPLADVPVCQGEKTPDLDADPHGANTNSLFQWKINEVEAGTAHSQPVKTDVQGLFTYIVRATINDPDPTKRCVALDTALVTVNPAAPESRLSSQFIICNDPENHDPATSQAVLDAGQFFAYEWKKDGTVIGTAQTVTVKETGKYQITYSTDKGCKKTAKTTVMADCIPKVVAPNAFRPESGEQINQTFSLLTYFITDDFQITIYNRWGQIVFQSDERNFKWNGGYLNDIDRPVPGDVYAYVVRYNGKYRTEEKQQEKRGGILLVR